MLKTSRISIYKKQGAFTPPKIIFFGGINIIMKKFFNRIFSIAKDSKKEIVIGAVISVLIVLAVLTLYILRSWVPLILLAVCLIWSYNYDEKQRQARLQQSKLSFIEQCLVLYEEHFRRALVAFSYELKFRPAGLGSNNFSVTRIKHQICRNYSSMTFKIACKNCFLSKDFLQKYSRELATLTEFFILEAFEKKFRQYLNATNFVLIKMNKEQDSFLTVEFYIKNDFIFDLNSEIN